MAERVFSLARLCVAAAIAALLVCAGALAYLARDLPSNPVDAQLFAVEDLKFVMGSGKADGERLLIDGFTDQYALLSSGPVAVNADDYRFLTVSLDRLPEGEAPSVFWRRSEAPADLVQLRLGASGDLLIELSRHTNWRGEISELGFLFRDDGGPAVKLGPARLEPDTFALRLRRWALSKRQTVGISYLAALALALAGIFIMSTDTAGALTALLVLLSLSLAAGYLLKKIDIGL